MQITQSQAASMIVETIKAKLVPMLVGSPGCGKSAIVHQIGKQFNLELIDLRLSQCDPTDLLGFPQVVNGKAAYIPMETFPIETDPLPEGRAGWLLFLDEFNSAPPAVQAAAYKLVLDRKVGGHNLHPNVAIVCAGNLETDNAIVQPMSTALQSRLVHFELAVDHKDWLDWAAENDIDHRITSYINFKPGNLYTFNPDHSDKTYAAPRTWEFVNRLIKGKEVDSPQMLPLIAGTISEGVAREFLGFCKIFERLPKISEIVTAPETVEVPQEPSILFALTGAIAHNADTKNITPLMSFVKRLPVEFQVVCMRETVRRNKELLKEAAIQKWITESANELF